VIAREHQNSAAFRRASSLNLAACSRSRIPPSEAATSNAGAGGASADGVASGNGCAFVGSGTLAAPSGSPRTATSTVLRKPASKSGQLAAAGHVAHDVQQIGQVASRGDPLARHALAFAKSAAKSARGWDKFVGHAILLDRYARAASAPCASTARWICSICS
jgi:hypothetical protein